jgi:hypothetical protein
MQFVVQLADPDDHSAVVDPISRQQRPRSLDRQRFVQVQHTTVFIEESAFGITRDAVIHRSHVAHHMRGAVDCFRVAIREIEQRAEFFTVPSAQRHA